MGGFAEDQASRQQELARWMKVDCIRSGESQIKMRLVECVYICHTTHIIPVLDILIRTEYGK